MIGGALAAALLAAPATASRRSESRDPARTYVAARAAALSGDYGRSAELLAALAEADPANLAVRRQATSEALAAGNTELAVRLARSHPVTDLAIDARLLLAADELRSKRFDRAGALLAGKNEGADISFLIPLLHAWWAAERGDLGRAVKALDGAPADGVLARLSDEHRAFILLKFRRTAEAEPYARRAIAAAQGRELRIRLGLADAFLAAGDRARAAAMVDGISGRALPLRAQVLAGRRNGLAVDTALEAFSEVFLSLAIDLNRVENRELPISLSRIARYADPNNSSAAILLGLFLAQADRTDAALAAFREVPRNDWLSPHARDGEAQALAEAGRVNEALAAASAAVRTPGAGAADFARLGDAFDEVKRHGEAADAYARATQLAEQGQRWQYLLLRASALESADRWPEARADLQAALALAPDQPLILNFLGYAKLERGEDLDTAEAMIRKASELAPNDASITDSLGWALYKRGRIEEAIEVLQKAARADAAQAEIHEHLGDALYAAGRKFEARFAWEAAVVTAEDDVAPRLRAKIVSGLTPATAAP
ncbi:MAG: tetratricopeptide repeat protein [Pseudomonadota bacterium]|nr:tetratricopeptide repeat protein [Pseudomonadota bacterium]